MDKDASRETRWKAPVTIQACEGGRQLGGGERPPDSKRILKVKNTGFSDIPAVSYKRKRCFIDDSEFGLRQKKRLQLP